MKKIILIFLLSFLYGGLIADDYKNIFISKSNGGQLGYNKVKETYENDGNIQSYELDCYNPGTNSCKFKEYDPTSSGPGPSPIIIDMEVIGLIENGTLSGTITIDNATATWNAIDKYNYNLNIHYQ
jgi:hypothetical protein